MACCSVLWQIYPATEFTSALSRTTMLPAHDIKSSVFARTSGPTIEGETVYCLYYGEKDGI